MPALLSVENVSFAYPGRHILDSVSFSAGSGEFIVLMGRNGAGKSTLLDIIAGLRDCDSGEIRIHGSPLSKLRARQRARRISHLPQGKRDELPFTVEQVVLMGRYAYADRWFESEADHSYALDAMRRVDCAQFRGRLFTTLSDGEQQRVLLAACIAQRPDVMLFDEPSTYLDVHQQLQCFATLRELAREGALCIAVTHDLNLGLAHCTRVLLLDGGRISRDIPAEKASVDPNWICALSPQLRIVNTPEGRPWILYP